MSKMSLELKLYVLATNHIVINEIIPEHWFSTESGFNHQETFSHVWRYSGLSHLGVRRECYWHQEKEE